MSLIETAGASDANSYLSVEEFDAYLDTRLNGLVVKSLSITIKEQLLIMATRTIDAVTGGVRVYINEDPPHFETRPTWTGAVATSTQALAWPRTGMLNRNGVEIPSDEIPRELKDATAELAFQFKSRDSTLDNSFAVKGITSLKAGPIELTFKDSILMSKVLPDAVLFLLVASWLTDVVYESVRTALFEVI